MDPDLVSDRSLRLRNDRPAHDRHNHHSRAIPGQRTQFRNSQSEDAGEHDGIEKSHEDDALHGDVSVAEHGDRDQRGRAHRANAKQLPCAHLLQKAPNR